MSKPSQTNPEIQIPVQDLEGKFLLPTSAANARKLLKTEQAKVQSKNPFSISLNKIVESPNTERKMQSINMHKFFSEPKAIYVQNITNPIGNISLEFREDSGQVIPVKIPATRNPVVLTDMVMFDVIKKSADFLKYFKATPSSGAKLQLLSEEEYFSYYEKRAKELEISNPQVLIEETQKKTDQLVQQEIIVTEAEARAPKTTNDPTVLEPEVNPRVMSTCQQLDPKNTSKITAREAIDVFNTLELTSIDFDYILSNCFDRVEGGTSNKVVRTWTIQHMGTAAADTGIIMHKEEKEEPKKTRVKVANAV